MDNVISGWFTFVFNIMHSLFSDLFIRDGVSFGNFLLVVFIFGIMISFLLRKIFKW